MKTKLTSLSALDDFNFSDLMQPPTAVANKVMMIPLNHIHEDQHNSRMIFDGAQLQELIRSITAMHPTTGKPRGIKSPLSLKPHPDKVGEYIINAGHRRFRAAQKIGLSEVPAFIDLNADDYDNAVDNIQRAELSPLEMAHFIKRRLELGDKKSTIAEQLGKTASFISDHALFFDLADCIRDLYDSGRCHSIQALALLQRSYTKHAQAIESFCRRPQGEFSTAQVRQFCEKLKTTSKEIQPTVSENIEYSSSTKYRKPCLKILHNDEPAELLSDLKSTFGTAWIRYEKDAHVVEIDLADIQLIAIVEAE
ncbi:MAG: ParB/RepB/Spo0J family partition protein [Pseudomonadota bacterium]